MNEQHERGGWKSTSTQRQKQKKRKTKPLGIIQEKLVFNSSFGLGQANTEWGKGGAKKHHVASRLDYAPGRKEHVHHSTVVCTCQEGSARSGFSCQ